MSIETLVQVLDATNNQNNELRKQAEGSLAAMTTVPGFFPNLVLILGNTTLASRVHYSAAIALKNRLRKMYDDEDGTPISEEDKSILREHIIPVLIQQSNVSIVSLMGLAVECMAKADLESKWGCCIPQIESGMTDGNSTHMYNAIYVIRSIFHAFQYSTQKQFIYSMQKHFYPSFLSWISSTLASTPSEESLRILHLVIKTYYTGLDLSSENISYFEVNDLRNWIVLTCQLVSMPVINQESNDSSVSVEEKNMLAEWHIKKWCMSILVRVGGIIVSVKKSNNGDYRTYVNEYAPGVINVILQQLQVYIHSDYYYSKVAIKLFTYLKGIIDISSLYKIVKKNMQFIINEVLPKALSMTNEEIILWKEDPISFVNQVYDLYYDFTNVRVEAGEFMCYLSKVRANDILGPFLDYLIKSFDSYNSVAYDQRNFLQKEWMLYTLELLSPNLLSKDCFRAQVERILQSYVYPEFQSPVGYLRSRACRVYVAFRKLQMDPEHLSMIVNGLLQCLNDDEFPVCISAAISIRSFINDNSCQEIMRPHVTFIVEKFITIATKVAVDDIIQSFESIVSVFCDDLQPLIPQILQMIIGAFNEYKKDQDNDTAVFTAMSTMDCISTLVLNAVKSKQYCDTVVRIIIPLLLTIFDNMEVDYFESAMFIIKTIVAFTDNCNETKDSNPAIKYLCIVIWSVFPPLVLMIEKEAMDYVSNFFSVVHEYLTTAESVQYLLNNSYNGKTYLEMIYAFVEDSLFDDELESIEQGYTLGVLMDTVQCMLYNCDQILDPSVALSMRFIAKKIEDMQSLINDQDPEEPSENEYFIDLAKGCIVRALMVIESCVIIKPEATMNCFIRLSLQDKFVDLIKEYGDCHETILSEKLLVNCLCALIGSISSLPPYYQQNCNAFFIIIVSLLGDIMEQKMEENGNGEDEDVDYDELLARLQGRSYKDNDWGVDQDEDVEDEEDDLDGVNLKQLETLAGMEGDFHEIEEISNAVTDIDTFKVFQAVFNTMNTANPSMMASLLSVLNPNQQGYFQSAMQMNEK